MAKKGRVKGTTYHLVQPSYEAQQAGAPAEAVWVSEADFRRNQRGRGDGADYDYAEVDGEAELHGFDDAAVAQLAAEDEDWSSVDDEGVVEDDAVAVVHGTATEHTASADDKLFDDEVECEVTDDFLHELVFGSAGPTEKSDSATAPSAAAAAGLDDETWALLTPEERAAVTATHRRHGDTAPLANAVDDDDDAVMHAGHDKDAPRALELQFERAMREFDADARINDAYTDDPRTHGSLAMEQYVTALEEFVAGRAGIDLETTEPARNKGLINQLKLLAHRAGVFDTDGKGGVFLTTVASEKAARFAAAFRQETERIREAARKRVSGAAQTTPTPDAEAATETTDAASEDLVVLELSNKADRLDCETAVSAYSTYFNQPNVIRAPPRRRNGRARDTHVAATQETVSDVLPHTTAEVRSLTRTKGETAEERRMRQAAAKAAQRARRQEKSMLKKAYKTVQAEEVKREATAQADRATVRLS